MIVQGEQSRRSGTAPTPVPKGSLSALHHRDFMLFWVTAIVSNSAAWMQLVATPKVLYDMTSSTAWLGYAAAAGMVPSVLLTPVAGVLADRMSRRLILIVTQLGQMVVAFGLWGLWLVDGLTPYRILALLFCNGVLSGFQVAAWQSFVPTLVPRESLMDAVRLNSVQFTAARAIGPGIGAFALGVFGVGTAFLLNAVTFVPVVIVIVLARPRQVVSATARENMATALREGFAYVKRRPLLWRSVAVALVVSFSGQSIMQIAAAIAVRVYERDSGRNAVLVAALGCGSVVMSVFLVAFGNRIRRSITLQFGLCSYAVGLAMVGLTKSFTLGVVGFFLVGVSHIPVAVSLNTFIQGCVPDEIRGRVVSIYLLGVMIGLPIGALVLGQLGDHFGLHPVLIANAVFFAVFVVAVFTWFGAMRGIDASSADQIEPVTPAR
jgi:MFS family permease